MAPRTEHGTRGSSPPESGLGIRRVPHAATDRGEEIRRLLVSAAVRCIAEKGYAGTSMRDIAAEADQNVANIYYYFPSKIILVTSVIEHCACATVNALGVTEIADAERSEGRTQRLLGSLLALAREPSLEAKVLMDLATQVSREPAHRRAIARALDDIVTAIARRLGGAESDPAARVLSDFLFSMFHGLVVMGGCFERPWSGTDELRTRAFEAIVISIQNALDGGAPESALASAVTARCSSTVGAPARRHRRCCTSRP